MKKILLTLTSLGVAGALGAQTPSPTPSPNDIESLRQQVQALTETVKTLQQQVKDQQDALAKMNAGPTTLPTNDNWRRHRDACRRARRPSFPTTDESVVATAPEPSPLPANAAAPPPAPAGSILPHDRRVRHHFERNDFDERRRRVPDRADDDRGRRPHLHEHLVRRPVCASPIRAIAISTSSK